MDKNIIRNAVLGLAVGDALGVPVEFSLQEMRRIEQVDDMWEYGTHDQPRGTWSDDTSMTLALMEGLTVSRDIPDYKQIMDNFVAWHDEQKYTATDELFDIGWEDYLNRGAVCAVEWSENVQDAFFGDEVRVSLEKLGDTRRQITVEGVELC